jgi:hypothetical protein
LRHPDGVVAQHGGHGQPQQEQHYQQTRTPTDNSHLRQLTFAGGDFPHNQANNANHGHTPVPQLGKMGKPKSTRPGGIHVEFVHITTSVN